MADRIAYDAAAYFNHNFPPQDAQTVFQTRKAVCAGYAKLLTALGEAIGEEIVYVVGHARTKRMFVAQLLFKLKIQISAG